VVKAARDAQLCLDGHQRTMDDLDDLGEIISGMLTHQQHVEVCLDIAGLFTFGRFMILTDGKRRGAAHLA
jgi:hypothetical protein